MLKLSATISAEEAEILKSELNALSYLATGNNSWEFRDGHNSASIKIQNDSVFYESTDVGQYPLLDIFLKHVELDSVHVDSITPEEITPLNDLLKKLNVEIPTLWEQVDKLCPRSEAHKAQEKSWQDMQIADARHPDVGILGRIARKLWR